VQARLLIVEDEALIALEIRARLLRMGYAVCGIVACAGEALQSVAKCKPDLVLMDICLKGVINGIEVAADIREKYGIPVIYLTSHADEDTLARAKNTAPYGFLRKPFQEQDLRISVELALHRYALDCQARESEDKFRLIAENIDDVFWLSTPDFEKLVYVSPAYEKIWGRRREDLHQDPLSFMEGVHQDDRDTVRALFGQPPAESLQLEYRVVRPDGSLSWVRDRRFPVLDSRGQSYRLAGVVTDVSAQKQAQTQLLVLNRQLQEQATHDPLTGLPNRRLLVDRLEQALALARRTDGHLAMLFIDLDGFKEINDRFGHVTGDRVLEAIGKRLHDLLRSTDTAARIGGDEFGILLANINDDGDAALVARKILDGLSAPLVLRDREIRLGASVGICLYPQHARSADELISRADAAMYQVKHAGKGAYAFYRQQTFP
jgi:diguanylate cyclase (GGDEF)-like protein/PAS domain S-box-containing protein